MARVFMPRRTEYGELGQNNEIEVGTLVNAIQELTESVQFLSFLLIVYGFLYGVHHRHMMHVLKTSNAAMDWEDISPLLYWKRHTRLIHRDKSLRFWFGLIFLFLLISAMIFFIILLNFYMLHILIFFLFHDMYPYPICVTL